MAKKVRKVAVSEEKISEEEVSDEKVSGEGKKSKTTSLATVLKTIESKYGKIITYPFSEKPRDKFSSGIVTLDYLLSGGFTEGLIYTLTGDYSSGKSLVAMMAVIQAIKKYPDRKVLYFDFEHSFAIDSATKVLNVPSDEEKEELIAEKMDRFVRYGFDPADKDRLLIIRPDSLDNFFVIVDQLIRTGEVSLVVLDSLTEAPSELHLSKMAEGKGTGVDQRPLIMSQRLPILKNPLYNNRTTLLGVAQMRSTQTMYGNPETIAGGKALPYASHAIIQLKKMKTDKKFVDESNKETGHPVGVYIIKYKGGIPIRYVKKLGREYNEFDLYYLDGPDNDSSLLDIAVKVFAVKVGGAYISWTHDGKEYKEYKKNFIKVVKEANVFPAFAKYVYAKMGLDGYECEKLEFVTEGMEGGEENE